MKGATPEGASRRPEPVRSFDSAIARLRRERGLRRGEEPEPGRRRDPAGRAREAEVAPSATRGTAVPGQPSSSAPSVPGSAPAGRHGGEPALPELREAARVIPPAIWAGRLEGVPSIELTFGRDLSVELRQGGAGIELAVRTGEPLVRAARVDLQALVQSLRARGVVVARAEVRGRPTRAGVAGR